uniref:ABC transporter domain-containing protein n=1 Tax=Globisporangium ultimum (strain ATCC 200006 / CBS 805.95 / DAOM BR144) TaxID=431595 RepID=K3WPQ7_GLOUD
MTTIVSHQPQAKRTPDVRLESGETFMAHGPHILHEYVSMKLEAALGRVLPQMEVRFSDLSLAADVAVVDEEEASPTSDLPTLLNTVKMAFSCISKRRARKEILKNVSGAFKSGTLTLVLGQPGSGKSALMKILSGRFPVEKNVTVEGKITYNGVPQEAIAKTLPQFAAYVNQRDRHFPGLTVKETLEFAHTFCGGELFRRGEELLSKGTPEENAEALEALRALFEHYPDVIIQQLGLQNCQDTVVGDSMTRGVSGGERKRVTVGEMEFGMRYVTFMDEISTGLDSAATYDIINTQRGIARKLRKTVVIALLQPSPEVFALFDDVMVLNEGEIMYHGPREQVVGYFQELGFVCPPERDVGDYLLDLGTSQQRKYEVGPPPHHRPRPRLASEFAEIFRQSEIFASTRQHLDAPHSPELLANVAAHMEPMAEFHQSFLESTVTLARRQLMVQSRNKPFICGRVAMVIVMGLLNSAMFFQFDPTQVNIVMGIIFATVIFLSLGQQSQIPTYVDAREVFYKQRRANFFRTSSYVLANAAAQFPLALVETIVFGTLSYWMCGFVSQASRFIIFEVVLLITHMTFGVWNFFVATLSPHNNIAGPVGMVSILTFVIFAGFIVTKAQMPDYLIWLYWISPVGWGLRGLAVNQYRSPEFDVCEYKGLNYCEQFNNQTMGEYYMSLFGVPTEKFWLPVSIAVLLVQYVIFMILSYLSLEYVRYEAPEKVTLGNKQQEDAAADTYMEVSTPKGSSGTPDSSTSSSGEVAVDIKPGERSFLPVTLAFQDLWYTVPLPRNPKHETIDLLKGITGSALPGTMTALMGSSGAGKTTLMDVIAGRKTGGKIRGKIFFNGYEASDLAIRRSTGYCEQMDIHSEASTIREALTFSAFLRQDSRVSAAKKLESVNECLTLLDMHGIADQIIRGSSVEQMKRLTIGVELAAQQSVLFLDEPTSGLDARSAKLIMDGVRKVADTGRTIVCTIHQPSSEVFFLFDSLLLLKRGGETVFFGELGEDCCNLINYFEAIPGVTPITPGYNPATWILECIGAGVSNTSAQDTDFVQVFKKSEHKRLLDTTMAKPGVSTPAPESGEVIFTNKRAAGNLVQMKFVVGRFMDVYWRTPSYNLTRFVLAIILALLFGVTFVDANYATYSGMNSGVGMVYLAVLFSGFVSFTSVIPVASDERASFYRERAAQTYNALWYFVGSTVAEIPYVFFSTLLFTVVFYPMVGFTGFGTAVIFWLNLALAVLLMTYMGHAFAYALPSDEVAGIIGVLVNTAFFLFMGFTPPASAIPQGLRWVHTITPQRFSLSIAAALAFTDCDQAPTWNETLGQYENVGSQLACQPLEDMPIDLGHMTVREITESMFGMERDNIVSYFFIVIAYIVGLLILSGLALRYINHQKR